MNPFAASVRSFTYPEFVQLTEDLVAAGRTTGPDQSEEMVHYTRLNLHRMRRWNKTFHPDEELINRLRGSGQSWWAITEPWCGDSAQSLPVLGIIAQASGIPFRIVLRDENTGIMDRYLTNGSRSIPILVAFDAEGDELFRWGARPAAAQKIVADWKHARGDKSYEDLKEEIHLWYARDKGQSLQQELMALASKPDQGFTG